MRIDANGGVSAEFRVLDTNLEGKVTLEILRDFRGKLYEPWILQIIDKKDLKSLGEYLISKSE